MKIKTFGSICSGVGMQEMAIKRVFPDVEIKYFSEIDKYAIKSYQAIHGDIKNLGDFTQATDIPYVDFMFASTPCFTGEQQIFTDKGYRDIKDIKINDKVLTDKNKYQRVTDFGVKKANAVLLKAQGVLETKTTLNHPYLTYKNGVTSWKEVQDLDKGDYLIQLINDNKVDFDITDDELWTLGRYVADGWLDKRKNVNAIMFSINNEKEKEFYEFNKNRNIYITNKGENVKTLCFSDKKFNKLCVKCGSGAANKIIPNFIINLPVNRLKLFVKGYMAGDGCYTQGTYKATTVSKRLALGLQQCILKVYNVLPSLYYTKRNKKHIIQGREVNQKDTYQIVYRLGKKRASYLIKNNKVFMPFKGIKHLGIETVYNITVENDNTYTINNSVVHNCQDFSVAGKQAGFEGMRGTLTFEWVKMLSKLKLENKLPKIIGFENVPAIMNKKFIDGFNLFKGQLENLGYNLSVEKLNAKDYGIPQNRNRVFMIGFLQEINFEFPEKFELKLRLKDILESEVEEKFYLNKLWKFSKDSDNKHDVNEIAQIKGINYRATRSITNPNKICRCLDTMSGGQREPKILVREATKKGYKEAFEGDSINLEQPNSKTRRGRVGTQVANTLITGCNQGVVIAASRGRNPLDPSDRTKGSPTVQRLEINRNGTSNCLTTVQKDNLVIEKTFVEKKYEKFIQKKGFIPKMFNPYNSKEIEDIAPLQTTQCGSTTSSAAVLKSEPSVINPLKGKTNNGWNFEQQVYDASGITRTVKAGGGSGNIPKVVSDLKIRKLTPKECWRLMGIKDSDFEKAQELNSNSQLYKQAGNGIVVDVLEYIFKEIKMFEAK